MPRAALVAQPQAAVGPATRTMQQSAPAACRGVVALEQPDGRAAARDGSPSRPGAKASAGAATSTPDVTPMAFRAVAAREERNNETHADQRHAGRRTARGDRGRPDAVRHRHRAAGPGTEEVQ